MVNEITRKNSKLGAFISSRVRLLRKEKRLSGTRIEQLTQGQISRSQLSKLETGVVAWSPYHLELIAEVLGVPVRELMPQDENNTSTEIESGKDRESGQSGKNETIDDESGEVDGLKVSKLDDEHEQILNALQETLQIARRLADSLDKRRI